VGFKPVMEENMRKIDSRTRTRGGIIPNKYKAAVFTPPIKKPNLEGLITIPHQIIVLYQISTISLKSTLAFH